MMRVCHFEIHAADPEKAIAFYHGLFGWQFSAWGGEAAYWLIRTGEPGTLGIDGGLVRRHGPAPSEGQSVNSYVCTVMVPALEAMMQTVVAAGGRIVVPKMPIPGVGWLAYATDTEGNIFGMMQSDADAK